MTQYGEPIVSRQLDVRMSVLTGFSEYRLLINKDWKEVFMFPTNVISKPATISKVCLQ